MLFIVMSDNYNRVTTNPKQINKNKFQQIYRNKRRRENGELRQNSCWWLCWCVALFKRFMRVNHKNSRKGIYWNQTSKNKNQITKNKTRYFTIVQWINQWMKPLHTFFFVVLHKTKWYTQFMWTYLLRLMSRLNNPCHLYLWKTITLNPKQTKWHLNIEWIYIPIIDKVAKPTKSKQEPKKM